GLQSDLGIRGDGPVGADLVQQPRDGGWSDPRGSATTEVDGPDLRRQLPGGIVLPDTPLPEHRIDILFGGHLPSDRDRKVAIAAAAGAEGDMEVEVHAGNLRDPRSIASLR